MANGRHRPMAPVRKVVAGVLGAFATFVVLFGVGMPNWTIVAIGVALLMLAVGIVAASAFRGGSRAWVSGTAHVQSVSEPPASSRFGRCEMQVVVQAPGLPVRSVKVRDPRVPVDKWPVPGAMLPVLVAIDDQRHVRIQWDDVLTHAEADAAEREDPYRDAGVDTLADEVLIEQQQPPWRQRDPDDDFLPPEEDILAPEPTESPTADLTEDLTGLRNEPSGATHQRPGEGVVLEGTLVDPPTVLPFPRRPQSDSPDTGVAAEPGLIQGVGLTILVADLDRSLTFYRDRLGFSEVDRGDDNVILASGQTRLVLRAIPDVAPVNRRLVHINLEVDDVHAVYEGLRSKGVRFTYPPRAVNRGTRLEQWAATFRDPDGHGIALTQWRTRTAT